MNEISIIPVKGLPEVKKGDDLASMAFDLINKSGNPGINRKRGKVASCNHCGGAFRNSGDMTACIMCSRESGHICGNCSHATTAILEKSKKSA
mgnify:CR=1 FL=1